MKNIIAQLYLISKNTFKEVLQAKVLFNILFVALGLILITFISTRFTFGVPHRIAIDIGLGLLTISSIVIALSLGVGLLSNEINNRTIYVILSRSVPRDVFLWGKFIGLFLILVTNILILGLSTIVCFYLLGGKVDNLIMWCIFYVVLEAGLVLSLSILVSLIASKSLAAIITLSLWLAGHGIDSAINTLFAQGNAWVTTILQVNKLLLPNFYKFNLKDYVLYQQDVSGNILLSGTFYALSYTLGVIVLSSFIFRRKNFD